MIAMPFPRSRFVAWSTIAALLSLASVPAAAQWVWKDEAGHVMASDQAPPADTPASRIIKQPKARTLPTPPAPKDPAADAAKPDAPKSLADRELDAKQQDKANAEAAKKAADDATRAQAMQDNCKAVRGNLAALQAGGRAARFNDKGEKVYIDDSQRQDEINRQQGQVAQYCK